MKILIFFLSFFPILAATPAKQTATIPTASARASVVMEMQTNTLLYANNADLVRSVASVSKIMTAIVAIENDNLSRQILITEEIKKAVGSMIYVKVGDSATLQDLLYGLMLRSGNDAAIAIAVGVAGSISDFVALMNAKAVALNMKNSLFRNPHGLDEFDGGNLSSAKDLATLMAYSLKNESFRQISGSKDYFAASLNMRWQNKNRLLSLYPHTSGGKTGYTKIAKRTLVTSAKINQTELITVTLDCGGDFSYHKKMYEHYFSLYQTRLLLAKGEYIYNHYQIINDRDYYFFADNNFWHKAIISIEIDEVKQTASLHLYAKDKKVTVANWPVKKVEVIKKISFWDRIVSFFRGLFS